MSGVRVLRYLLANNAGVLAVIPAARIMTGDLPVNAVMPAISVTQISSVPYNTMNPNESPKLHTDRVQVSALFKGQEGTPAGTGYPGIKAMMKLVLAACPNQYGTINGIAVDSIVPDIEGPELSDVVTALYSQSRDFIVRWSE